MAYQSSVENIYGITNENNNTKNGKSSEQPKDSSSTQTKNNTTLTRHKAMVISDNIKRSVLMKEQFANRNSSTNVFHLSKAEEIVGIIGCGGIGISRPVRSGKTNLLNDVKYFYTNENGKRREVIEEATKILKQYEETPLPDFYKTDESLSRRIRMLKTGLLEAARLFPDSKFIIFKFDFSIVSRPNDLENEDTNEFLASIQEYQVKYINSILDISSSDNTIHHFFNNIKRDEFGLESQLIKKFEEKLNNIIQIKNLSGKILLLDEFINFVNTCLENNRDKRKPVPWVPKIVILIDEVNYFELKIKRMIFDIEKEIQECKPLPIPELDSKSMISAIKKVKLINEYNTNLPGYTDLKKRQKVLVRNLQLSISHNMNFLHTVNSGYYVYTYY